MSLLEQVSVSKKPTSTLMAKWLAVAYFCRWQQADLRCCITGEYEFSTSQGEIMEVTSGRFEVLLPESSVWQEFREGTQFELAANVSFKIRNTAIAEYCCSYL